MKKSTNSQAFTAREIGDSVNNAVVKALRSIPEERLRKLRAYSQGLLAPMLKHVEEEYLRNEEVVAILLTAALFVQLQHVMHTDKLPMAKQVIDHYEGSEAVALPELYYQTPEPRPEEILPREPRADKHGKKRKNV